MRECSQTLPKFQLLYLQQSLAEVLHSTESNGETLAFAGVCFWVNLLLQMYFCFLTVLFKQSSSPLSFACPPEIQLLVNAAGSICKIKSCTIIATA